MTSFHFVIILADVNVVSRPAVDAAIARHSDATAWLETWWTTAKSARWENLHDVRADYPSADQYGRCLIFNARGNKYRLIVRIVYADRWQNGTVFIKRFLTHAEYDKGGWKGVCR